MITTLTSEVKSAKQLAWIDCDVGRRALYKVNPPMKDYGDIAHEYVVVTETTTPVEEELRSYIFSADEDGDIHWSNELYEFHGWSDIERALREAGYEYIQPLPDVSPDMVVDLDSDDSMGLH